MTDRVARGGKRHGVLCGARRKGGGLGPVAGLPAVIRQCLDDGVERIGMLSGERRGDFTMQGDTFPREQLGVDGLAGEGVAKGESVCRFLDDELRLDELLDEGEQLALDVTRERL